MSSVDTISNEINRDLADAVESECRMLNAGPVTAAALDEIDGTVDDPIVRIAPSRGSRRPRAGRRARHMSQPARDELAPRGSRPCSRCLEERDMGTGPCPHCGRQ